MSSAIEALEQSEQQTRETALADYLECLRTDSNPATLAKAAAVLAKTVVNMRRDREILVEADQLAARCVDADDPAVEAARESAYQKWRAYEAETREILEARGKEGAVLQALADDLRNKQNRARDRKRDLIRFQQRHRDLFPDAPLPPVDPPSTSDGVVSDGGLRPDPAVERAKPSRTAPL